MGLALVAVFVDLVDHLRIKIVVAGSFKHFDEAVGSGVTKTSMKLSDLSFGQMVDGYFLTVKQ